jgi:hypothetical protein
MSQGPFAMAEPTFSPMGEDNDDLPRTFRREKEAREREAREREAKEREAQARVAAERQAKDRQSRDRPAVAAPTLSTAPEAFAPGPQVYADPAQQPDITDMPYPASVRRFDVPFIHLMTFFLKAVLAAIPALILLGVILWFAGSALQAVFPDLVKMKILISFPN